MNSSAANLSNTSSREDAINDVAYSIGFSVIVIVVLLIVSYISYKLNRAWGCNDTNRGHTTSSSSTSSPHPVAGAVMIVPTPLGWRRRGGGGGGIDEAALVNYPKFMYSQAKLIKGDDPVIASGCSICLADYKDSDMLRLLPECGHLFHLDCIDPWLKLHPTCPICRSSPLPTPPQVVPPPAPQS